MSQNAVIRESARRDLVEIFVYLGENNIDAAERFLESARQTFAQLTDMPGMGSPRRFADSRLAGVRCWPVRSFDDYLIYYRSVDSGIDVLRVLHTARDIQAILEERS